MPIDNQMYDRLAGTWWDEDENLALLRTGVNPPRIEYIRRTLVDTLGLEPAELSALDVGCGGGLLAEEVARLGCRVTGVDPSEPSLETARAHAEEQGLAIAYVPAAGEDLPFGDASFDLVYCCDVLEHVNSLDRTIEESARMLKPGGVYIFDTINRTRRSKLLMIKLMQEWDATRCMEPDLHDWDMFIKPEELEETLRRHGLDPRETVGMAPGRFGPLLLADMRKRVKGKISYAELGRRMDMRESRDKSTLYAGYALKG